MGADAIESPQGFVEDEFDVVFVSEPEEGGNPFDGGWFVWHPEIWAVR